MGSPKILPPSKILRILGIVTPGVIFLLCIFIMFLFLTHLFYAGLLNLWHKFTTTCICALPATVWVRGEAVVDIIFVVLFAIFWAINFVRVLRLCPPIRPVVVLSFYIVIKIYSEFFALLPLSFIIYFVTFFFTM